MKEKSKMRGRNEGSIYRRKDGYWVACVSCGVDMKGKRIRKNIYGKSRSEVATKLIIELNNSIKRGRFAINNETLQALIMEWLLTFKKAAVSSITFERIISKAKLYIIPAIGHLKLQEVSVVNIQRVLNDLATAGYALDTIKKVKFLLRQFFEYAEENEWIFKNPMQRIKLPVQDKSLKDKYKAIPIEMRPLFLSHINENPIFKPMCLIMMFAGLRIGEVLALKWSDINFDERLISINSAVAVNTIFDKCGNVIKREAKISTTKTAASVREVAMPIMLSDALLEWRQIRLQRQNETGTSFCAISDLVFSNNEGKLRNYHGIKRMFERFLIKGELNNLGIHFHTLRHTYSSILFECGVNPKIIQLSLGHKEITTTLKIYNSIDRSHFLNTALKLDNIFSIYSNKKD